MNETTKKEAKMKTIKEFKGYKILKFPNELYAVDNGYSFLGKYKTLKGAEKGFKKALTMAGILK